jgi:hypothetical protein
MQRGLPMLLAGLWMGGVAQAQTDPAMPVPRTAPAEEPQGAPPAAEETPPVPTTPEPTPSAPAPAPPVVPDTPAPATIMVLPVTLNVPAAQAEGLGPVLTDALTHAMAERKRHPTVSAVELRQMVERETAAQGAGCDSTCTAEIAGALGARLAVTSDVGQRGEALVWSASLVQLADATVLARANVRGRGPQALVNQAAELAAALHGEAGATRLKGADAARRLGLEDRHTLEDFAAFREANPQWTTHEAFTTFLARRNMEHPATSAAQAALAGGAVAFTLATVAGVGAGVVVGLLLHPAVGLLMLAGGLVCAATAAALGVAAVALLVVDAMNLGAVKVHREGCCRDDAALQDLEADDGWHRASAVTFLLHPPVLLGGLFVAAGLLLAALAVTGLVGSALPDVGNGAVANGLFLLGGFIAVPVMLLLLVPPVLLSPVLGLLLLFWPNRPAVVDAPLPPPASTAGGKP